jgi:23S rRNA (uracil1939-C5)-methyltransferase
MTPEPSEVTIDRLGAQGDGIAVTPAGDVFVPGALPGERWRLGAGEIPPQRMSDGPDRRVPPCRHAGTCGGCAMQHLQPEAYRVWKHATVVQAFAHRGLSPAVAKLESVPLHSRRRAVFGIAHRHAAAGSDGPGRIEIGFREAGQHRLVDLAECPVLDGRIVAALDGLRHLAGPLIAPGTGGRLVVTATETGLDVTLSTGSIKLSPGQRARVAAAADKLGLARLTVERDAIIIRQRPRLTIGGVAVEPPNGIFLQAVAAAEARLSELVLAGIGKSRRVADLFCGIGTFAFPLARKATVVAADDDKASLETLVDALRSAQGLKPIEVKRRDLFREPLSPMELAGLDAVVLDPPRAGAQAQVEAIARSKVSRVVYVSCNPATMARDARILVDAGFALGSVTPIDQFVFSPHVEAVTVLSR